MPVDPSFHDYVLYDLFEGVEGVTSRKMFGGWGIYRDGIFFALISDGELYFKVGKNNQADFEEIGSHPFEYESRGKKITMRYWLVPEEIMEDREKFIRFAERAVKDAKSFKKNSKSRQ